MLSTRRRILSTRRRILSTRARLFSVKDTYVLNHVLSFEKFNTSDPIPSAAVNITVLVNTARVNVFLFESDTVVYIYIHLQQLSNSDVPISCKQV